VVLVGPISVLGLSRRRFLLHHCGLQAVGARLHHILWGELAHGLVGLLRLKLRNELIVVDGCNFS
jgi:hypothetical protein